MARILADENFPQPTVEALRVLGHDVLTLLDAGLAGQAIPDDEILAFALAQIRVLVTLNRKHFIMLHIAGHPHSGIIVCTFDRDSVALASRIHAVLLESNPEHRLIRVNRPQT